MLARKELEISVRLLVDRLRDIRLADGHPEITYLPSLIVRCPQTLLLQFEQA
jgi:cytochrome P450